MTDRDTEARLHVEGARVVGDDGEPTALPHTSIRLMTGFLSTLTPEQRGEALAYRGPDGPIGANTNVPVAEQLTGQRTVSYIVEDTYRRYPKMMGALARSEKEDELRALPSGIVYLGSPYTLYPHGLLMAARMATIATARLMKLGHAAYSPIAHGHQCAAFGDLPLVWEFWKAQCQPMIDAASCLVVLKLDGWKDSVGLNYEIEQFEGRPVVYVTMEDLRVAAEAKETWTEKELAA